MGQCRLGSTLGEPSLPKACSTSPTEIRVAAGVAPDIGREGEEASQNSLLPFGPLPPKEYLSANAANRKAVGGMSEGRLVVTVSEAAELLGISRGLAYELARAGQMPSLRLGRRLVVPRAALVTWLEQAARPESRERRKEQW